jgi:DNA-binding transcriptional MocR family regulator
MDHLLVNRQKALATECLTYGALPDLIGVARVKAVGVAIDQEGLVPEALAEVAATGAIGAIYCNPTLHNPTTAVMSEGRRKAIAAIAAQNGLCVIEDDPLGPLDHALPRPIAAFHPESVWYISGFTKLIAQGMRLAYLVAPDPAAAQSFLDAARRRSHWMAAPLTAALVTGMIRRGSAAAIRAELAAENLFRQRAAVAALARHGLVAASGSPHVWLPLPDGCRASDMVEALASRRILVRAAARFSVGPIPPPEAIRLSLSSVDGREALTEGLKRISAILDQRPV